MPQLGLFVNSMSVRWTVGGLHPPASVPGTGNRAGTTDALPGRRPQPRPPITTGQAERVADRVAATGRELTAIYVTHGHGDHWFGTAALLRRALAGGGREDDVHG
jgi:glyoxylase-like metal-dependent hydrolase (beta-lactamase superfamily II)